MGRLVLSSSLVGLLCAVVAASPAWAITRPGGPVRVGGAAGGSLPFVVTTVPHATPPAPPRGGAPDSLFFSQVPGSDLAGPAGFFASKPTGFFHVAGTPASETWVQFNPAPTANEAADGGIHLVFVPESASSAYSIRCRVTGANLYDIGASADYFVSGLGRIKSPDGFSYTPLAVNGASLPGAGGTLEIDYEPGGVPMPDEISIFLSAKATWSWGGCIAVRR